MPEIELKLELNAADIERLAASDLLGETSITVEQRSVYFDTADRMLFDAGFSLRIRRVGDVRTQTVKATGRSASLFARSEWELPVEGDAPALDHSSPLVNEFGDIGGALAPKFEVVVHRRTWSLTEGNSTIEVAADVGVARAGDRETQISEVELELKDGNPKDLFVLARKIEAIAPVKFGVLSKAARGYRLIEVLPVVHKAEPVFLDGTSAASKGLQAILTSCFRQFRLNEAIVLKRRNPEALHHSRVAIRRLRSAISLFKPLLGDEARRLSGEFRWLAGVLGDARNIDVLLAKAKKGDLGERLRQERELTYDDVADALESSRARALMLDFSEWLETGDYLVGPANDITIETHASAALDKMRKKLKKHGRDLAHVDDEHRHEARKDAKKLRCAAEFFRSIYSDDKGQRRHGRFIKAMEELQDRLGELNDLATGPSVIGKHGLEEYPDAQAVLSHADKDKLIKAALAALEEVLDTKRFWR